MYESSVRLENSAANKGSVDTQSAIIEAIELLVGSSTELTADTEISTVPGWDSVMAVHLLALLGQKLDRNIPISVLIDLSSVGQLSKAIDQIE